MTHLHFLKLGSEYLQFGALDLLRSLIGDLKNFPRFLGYLHMRDPMEFVS